MNGAARRSGMWWEFDASPRVSYYTFLRAVYGMEALAAWKRSASLPPTPQQIREAIYG